jgi:hypothetical protein
LDVFLLIMRPKNEKSKAAILAALQIPHAGGPLGWNRETWSGKTPAAPKRRTRRRIPMPDHPSPLPSDWGTILDQIHERLREATAAAQERADALPAEPPADISPDRRKDLDELAPRLQRLAAGAEAAGDLAAEADQALVAGEEALRRQLDAAESVRRRLATWAARAIG